MAFKYDNILFDLDGTLSDSYQGIENGIRFALENTGIKKISEREIKRLIGTPLTESLNRYYFNDTQKTWKAVEYFREYYRTKGINESELYPGIEELLELVSKFSKLYVITAKPTVYAKQLLEFHNVSCFFKEIKGCELDGWGLKKSELIKQVPEINNSIIIGDKMQDIEAGKENGIKTCGVLYGYGTEKEIIDSNPDYIARSVTELKSILSY